MSDDLVGGWFATAGQWIGSLQNCTTAYSWDGTTWRTRDEAIEHGFEEFGSDDFNVGQVIDGVVAWFGWMHEEFTDPEDTQAVAEGLGFRVPRSPMKSSPETP